MLPTPPPHVHSAFSPWRLICMNLITGPLCLLEPYWVQSVGTPSQELHEAGQTEYGLIWCQLHPAHGTLLLMLSLVTEGHQPSLHSFPFPDFGNSWHPSLWYNFRVIKYRLLPALRYHTVLYGFSIPWSYGPKHTCESSSSCPNLSVCFLLASWPRQFPFPF